MSSTADGEPVESVAGAIDGCIDACIEADVNDDVLSLKEFGFMLMSEVWRAVIFRKEFTS